MYTATSDRPLVNRSRIISFGTLPILYAGLHTSYPLVSRSLSVGRSGLDCSAWDSPQWDRLRCRTATDLPTVTDLAE